MAVAVEALYTNLDFWQGCISARQQVMQQADTDYEKSIHAEAIQRIDIIVESLRAGKTLDRIPEFRRWLSHNRSI